MAGKERFEILLEEISNNVKAILEEQIHIIREMKEVRIELRENIRELTRRLS